jgi:DNA-binding transcriptional ArsR family regulator
MDADLLRSLKALSDASRLRIVGLLAGEPMAVQELADGLGLGAPTIARHLERLRAAGLVTAVPDGRSAKYRLRLERLAEIGRGLDALEAGAAAPTAAADGAGPPLDPEDAKVLRAYLEGDRLVTIPARSKKRLVILAWLLERCFPEPRDYPEREVNALLALHHPDVAALRRYLVDEGLMVREAGRYRRADG